MTVSATSTSPLALQRPTTSDALAEAIATTTARGHQAQITGSNSMPLMRFNTARPIQPISTLRCNKIVEHAVSDMTVIVQAGMSLDALQQQLAWHNQWLPVDPPALHGRSPVQRTIGGLIAGNSLGPLRYKFGDWRFLLLGMRWIDGTGALIKGGGRTVKNVAGYSTPRLMIGSAGTLGAIAEVTLRTCARPSDEQCLIIFSNGAEQAEQILAAILTAPLEPAYIQAIGGQGFADNLLQLPVSPIVLVVGFLDRPVLCAAQLGVLRKLPELAGVETIAQTAAQAGRLRLWMTSEPEGFIHFRIHAMSSQITELIAAIQAAAIATNSRCRLVAEAGQGVIRGTLLARDAAAAERFWNALQYLCDNHNVKLNLLRANPDISIRSRPTPRDIYDRLKMALDPQHTFGNLM